MLGKHCVIKCFMLISENNLSLHRGAACRRNTKSTHNRITGMCIQVHTLNGKKEQLLEDKSF